MTSRFIIKAGIVLTLACLSAPIAAAGGWAPPGQAGNFDGRSPDTKDAAYAAHHTSRTPAIAATSATRPGKATTLDGRSPDTRDAALGAHRNASSTYNVSIGYASPPLNGTGYDGRSQDTKDAALAAHNPATTVVVASAGGFDWTDAGIGAAAGFGLAVMLAAGLTLIRKETTVTAS